MTNGKQIKGQSDARHVREYSSHLPDGNWGIDENLVSFGAHQAQVHRTVPLVPLRHDRLLAPPQPPDCHDGRHLCQDCCYQERVDAAVGKDSSDHREEYSTSREAEAARPVLR